MTASLGGMSDCPYWWQTMALAEGKHVYDIGANGGVVSDMFAKRFTQVDAFEPAIESYEILQFRESQFPNLRTHNFALSNLDGEERFREAEESIVTGQLVTADSTAWGATQGYRMIEVRRVDSLTKELGVPDTMKIDVEGHELKVLEGAYETLDSHHPRLLLEIHSEQLGVQTIDLLMKLGYNTIDCRRHSGYPEDHEGFLNHYYIDAHA